MLTPPSASWHQCFPAEVFPTRFRASAHGMSAACGKAGAIISALAFNSLSKKIGTPAVLWSASRLPFFFSFCPPLPLSLSSRSACRSAVRDADERSVRQSSSGVVLPAPGSRCCSPRCATAIRTSSTNRSSVSVSGIAAVERCGIDVGRGDVDVDGGRTIGS